VGCRVGGISYREATKNTKNSWLVLGGVFVWAISIKKNNRVEVWAGAVCSRVNLPHKGGFRKRGHEIVNRNEDYLEKKKGKKKKKTRSLI